MDREHKIYGLTDPITNQLKYVGQTVKKLKCRYNAHINERGNNRKNQWIKSLKNKDYLPEIFLLDIADTTKECNELEVFWISYFMFIGCRLTNATVGGEGVSGYKQSEEQKKKRSLARMGYKISDKTKRKIGESKKNLSDQARQNLSRASKKRGMSRKIFEASIKARAKRTPEQREAFAALIAASNRTRPVSQETRKRLRARFKGIPRSEETKKKISETMKGRKYPKERIQKRLDTIRKNKHNGAKTLSD